MSLSNTAKNENEGHAEAVSDKILTVPNVISAIRLLLVPVFMALLFNGHDIAALVVFSVAAATDFLDGQIARRTNQVTKLGKLLDPAVDTTLMVTGALSVCLIGRVPIWVFVIVAARELFLLCGGAVLLRRYGIKVPVIYPGKVATTLMFFGFAGMLLNAPVIQGLGICDIPWLPGFDGSPVAFWIWPIYIGLAMQIGVTVFYCMSAYRQLAQKKRELGEAGA